MEGKLIKLGEGKYDLLVDFDPKVLEGYELSLTNCQAIERGYDLDELAEDYYDSLSDTLLFVEGELKYSKKDFKAGFQKALEILGDKKFSEEDLREAISQTRKGMLYNKKYEDDYIKSLQQTEWEVEIEMVSIGRVKVGVGSKTEQMMPKLDADGCLILKRK